MTGARQLISSVATSIREGHARVPVDHVENGFALGMWVSARRGEHRRARLAPERVADLERLPGWTWRPREDHRAGLEALLRYVAREGHARVPVRHLEDGFRLGAWVASRRHGRNPPDLTAALEALPGWRWDPFEDDWRSAFEYLQTYVQREGHARVPQRHVEVGFRLGTWVNAQRGERRRGKLSPEKVALLGELPGWIWGTQEDDWRRAYKLLERFVAREGHARVPRSHVEDGFGLGPWVTRNRSDAARGSLSPEPQVGSGGPPGLGVAAS